MFTVTAEGRTSSTGRSFRVFHYYCSIILLAQPRPTPGMIPTIFFVELFDARSRQGLEAFNTFPAMFGFPSPLFLASYCAFSTFRFRLNLMLAPGIPPAFRGGLHFFIPPFAIGSAPSLSGNANAYLDGVQCRKSAGTGTVAPKVIPVTDAAFSDFTTEQFLCASLFSHPPLVLQCISRRYRYINDEPTLLRLEIQNSGNLKLGEFRISGEPILWGSGN